MYTIFIYNNESRRLERYRLESYQRIPYNCCNPLYVSDFFSGTVSTLGWTSTEFIFKWNKLPHSSFNPITIFRRPFEGGYASESMHFAGLAADLSEEPQTHCFPFCDKNHIALAPAGFPTLQFGDLGIFVLILQDCLYSLGFCDGELDGFFGPKTQDALSHFLYKHSLNPATVCGKDIWQKLTFHAIGCGINANTKHIDKSKIIL